MFQKATKKRTKLRLAITGASGSGKTYSSLILASSISDKIALIDTEGTSSDAYADKFSFSSVSMTPPYTPERFIEAINEAVKEGFEVLIIDSLSHEWEGSGGYIDLKHQLNDPYSAKVSPRHRKLVDAILQCPIHIIGTMRSKTAYDTSQNDKGKLKLTKIGTAPVQKENMEYEFTIVFDLNENHIASCSKDRTGLFDGKDFLIDKEIGQTLISWLNDGEEVPIPKIESERDKEFKILEDLYCMMSEAVSIEDLACKFKEAQRILVEKGKSKLKPELAAHKDVLKRNFVIEEDIQV